MQVTTVHVLLGLQCLACKASTLPNAQLNNQHFFDHHWMSKVKSRMTTVHVLLGLHCKHSAQCSRSSTTSSIC